MRSTSLDSMHFESRAYYQHNKENGLLLLEALSANILPRLSQRETDGDHTTTREVQRKHGGNQEVMILSA